MNTTPKLPKRQNALSSGKPGIHRLFTSFATHNMTPSDMNGSFVCIQHRGGVGEATNRASQWMCLRMWYGGLENTTCSFGFPSRTASPNPDQLRLTLFRLYLSQNKRREGGKPRFSTVPKVSLFTLATRSLSIPSSPEKITAEVRSKSSTQRHSSVVLVKMDANEGQVSLETFRAMSQLSRLGVMSPWLSHWHVPLAVIWAKVMAWRETLALLSKHLTKGWQEAKQHSTRLEIQPVAGGFQPSSHTRQW